MTREKLKEKPGFPDKSVYPEKDGYLDTKIAGYNIRNNVFKSRSNLRQNS
jgi:hypothetical protein